MADQTYNLTQTGAQVQAIINDANGVKGAGATTSLTTDYIMLKDTSGAYHKIQKSSFTEAVRNTLASLLVNNDKGTTISQIAAIASGDFGSVTPANLASVLGVPANKGSYSGDLNLLKSPGCYFTNHNGTEAQNNSPYPFGRLRVTIYGEPGVIRVLQEIFYIYTGHCYCSLRTANLDSSGTPTWSEWFEVYHLT